MERNKVCLPLPIQLKQLTITRRAKSRAFPSRPRSCSGRKLPLKSDNKGEFRRVTMGQADAAPSLPRERLCSLSDARKPVALKKAAKPQPLATSTNRGSTGRWISNAPARQFMQGMDEAAKTASLVGH